MQDRRVHDGAGRNADTFGRQVHVDRLQHQAAQVMLLEQMAETAHRGLIRSRRDTKVHTHETPQRRGLIQRFFNARVPRG